MRKSAGSAVENLGGRGKERAPGQSKSDEPLI
jgi:hypothetical protein